MIKNVVSILKIIFHFIKAFVKKYEKEIMELLWELLMRIVKDAREKKKAEQQQTT